MPGQFEAPYYKATGNFVKTELLHADPTRANPDQRAVGATLLRADFIDRQAKSADLERERDARVPSGPNRPNVEARDRAGQPAFSFENLVADMRADRDGYQLAIDTADRVEWQRPVATPLPPVLLDKRYRDEVSRLAWQLSSADRKELIASLTALADTSRDRGATDPEERFRQQIANIKAGGRRPSRRRERRPAEQLDEAIQPLNPLEAQSVEVDQAAEQIRQELIRIRAEAVAAGRADIVPTADEIEALTDEAVQQVWAEIQQGQQQVDGDQQPVRFDRVSTQSLNVEAADDTESERVFSLTEIHSDETITTDETGAVIMKKLTPDDLKDRGLLPKHKIVMGGREVWMSDPYKLDEGRVAVVGYTADDKGRFVARSFYRSNSQGSWRYLPHHTYTWYGKGYSEDSVNLPFQMQESLAQISQDENSYKEVENPDFILLGTARYNPKLIYPAEVQGKIDVINGQIGALDPSDPDFADRKAQLQIKVNNLNVLMTTAQKVNTMKLTVGKEPIKLEGNFYPSTGKMKPEELQFTNLDQKPNFSIKPPMTWIQNTSLYGQVTAEVYPSQDGRLNYLIFKDANGKVWVGGVEDTQSPVSRVGVRRNWINAGDLTTPAYEYDDQTGGYENSSDVRQGYFDMSVNYLSHVPIIQEYQSLEDVRNKASVPVSPIKAPSVPRPPRPPSVPVPPSAPDATPPVLPKPPEFQFDPTTPLVDQIGDEIERGGNLNFSVDERRIQEILGSLMGDGGNIAGKFTQEGYKFKGINIKTNGMTIDVDGVLANNTSTGPGRLQLRDFSITVTKAPIIMGGKPGGQVLANNKATKYQKPETILEEAILQKLNEQLQAGGKNVTLNGLDLSLDLQKKVLHGNVKGATN